jgi:Tfp pilus assembly protein PilF
VIRNSLLVALAVATLVGCGGTPKRTVRGKAEKVVLPPVKPEALREFDAGMRALRLGGPEATMKARERLRRAVEIDGKLWEAWHNLGVIAERDGDDDTAAEAFGKAVELQPASGESLLGRAEANRRAGNRSKAKADYQRLLDIDPEDREIAARLASLLRESKEYEDAIDVIREAFRNAGASANLYVELALVYLAQGRDELASLVLSKAADLDDEQPAVYNAMALLALDKGKDQRAFELFDKATSLDPGYVDARFNKASVLLDAGDYARAKQELEAVVQRAEDDYAALVALGVAQRGLRQYDRARATWERVVKAAPRGARARGDALFNLAVLEMDHLQEDKAAIAALDRYLQQSRASHPKRAEAEQRKKELGP